MHVWDSPGLQDGTPESNQAEYLKQMNEKCVGRDLTLYCIDVTGKRFVRGNDNPDVVAMQKFSNSIPNFWENTVIVLTYANYLKPPPMKGKPEEIVKAKIEILRQWREQIRVILREDIKISEEIVEKIKIVPAGYHNEIHLDVQTYWLSNIWRQCFDSIKTKEARIALVKMNVSRLMTDKKVKDEDFNGPPEKQPIIVKRWGSYLLNALWIATNAGADLTRTLSDFGVPYTKEVSVGFKCLATVVKFISGYCEERS